MYTRNERKKLNHKFEGVVIISLLNICPILWKAKFGVADVSVMIVSVNNKIQFFVIFFIAV